MVRIAPLRMARWTLAWLVRFFCPGHVSMAAHPELFLTSPRGGEIARLHHPAWERLTEGARRLHSRNSYQVLGEFLNDPARFVLCWTADGREGAASRSKKTGGTGMAIAIADLHGIPVINMANEGWHAKLLTVLAGIPEMAGMRLPLPPISPAARPRTKVVFRAGFGIPI